MHLKWEDELVWSVEDGKEITGAEYGLKYGYPQQKYTYVKELDRILLYCEYLKLRPKNRSHMVIKMVNNDPNTPPIEFYRQIKDRDGDVRMEKEMVGKHTWSIDK